MDSDAPRTAVGNGWIVIVSVSTKLNALLSDPKAALGAVVHDRAPERLIYEKYVDYPAEGSCGFRETRVSVFKPAGNGRPAFGCNGHPPVFSDSRWTGFIPEGCGVPTRLPGFSGSRGLEEALPIQRNASPSAQLVESYCHVFRVQEVHPIQCRSHLPAQRVDSQS